MQQLSIRGPHGEVVGCEIAVRALASISLVFGGGGVFFNFFFFFFFLNLSSLSEDSTRDTNGIGKCLNKEYTTCLFKLKFTSRRLSRNFICKSNWAKAPRLLILTRHVLRRMKRT